MRRLLWIGIVSGLALSALVAWWWWPQKPLSSVYVAPFLASEGGSGADNATPVEASAGSFRDDAALTQAARQVPWTHAFRRSLDGKKAPSTHRARVFWTARALHVEFDVDDAHRVATLTKRDADLWTQDVVEVFLDRGGDGKNYVELQVSPTGVVFDARFASYRHALPRSRRWNADVRATVHDRDGGWRARLSVPFSDLGGPPEVGETWRINLYRIDHHADGAADYLAWTPPLVGDFHALDRFGTLVFGGPLR